MTFNILMNHIATVFLGMNMATTLTFDSEITDYIYGGRAKDVFIKVSKDSKTIIFQPHKELISSNMLVITKKRSYQFMISQDDQHPHLFVDIKHGSINSNFKKVLETDSYNILEGSSSLLVINKENNPLEVNNILIHKNHHFSKGIPILIKGQRVLN